MTRWQRLHGPALVLAVGSIPLGEGLSLIGFGAVLLILVARRWELDRHFWRRGPLGGYLAGLAVWLVAGLLAVVLSGQWLKPLELARWLPFLAAPLVAASGALVEPRWLTRAGWAFGMALSVAALLGLCQYVFNVRPGEALMRVDTSIASQARVPGDYAHAAASGFYFHRLKLAHVLLVGIGAVCAHLVFGRPALRLRLLLGGVTAMLTATLLLTFARGAVLAAVAGLAALLLLAPWRWRLGAMLAAILALGLVWSTPTLRSRLESVASHEASGVRGLIWSQGVRVIADAPLGAGIGNYSRLVGAYYDTMDPSFVTRTYPHNIVLAAWAEAGPVGLIGFTWAWLSLASACWRRLRDGRPSVEAAAAGAGLFAVVAMWVVGMTHDLFYHNAVTLAYSALAGWVFSVLASEKPVELVPAGTVAALLRRHH